MFARSEGDCPRNQPGGRAQITGLVTRFSLKPGSEVAPAAPVQMQLLSQTDLVKILGNTYYADCDHSEDEPLGRVPVDRTVGRTGASSSTGRSR